MAHTLEHNPFTTPSPDRTEGYNNPFGQSALYGDNTNNDPFGQGFGLEQSLSRESAVDGRPPLSERLKQKVGTVLDIGGRAVRSMMKLMESGKLGARAAGRAEQVNQVYGMAGDMYQVYGNAGQAYDTFRQDAGSAWDNRSQLGRQAANFVGNAAKDIVGAGLQGALRDVGERTGVSYEEGRLSVRKGKLAKFALSAVLAPHATAANTLRGVAYAGFDASRKRGVSHARDAVTDARGAAVNYARNFY